jgi:5,6,7,8-tetrahydromethanopterin hydro-lyase
MSAFATQVGEGFAGDGPNAAHLNTVLGAKGGPVETAWATSLATPSRGHARFVVVLQPNLPVKPLTLFVPKAEVSAEGHARLTWGPAQAGVAGGVVDAVRTGIIDSGAVDDLLLIAAVWVDPHASDPELVYANNRAATLAALRVGREGGPALEAVLAAGDAPSNPFFEASRPTR